MAADTVADVGLAMSATPPASSAVSASAAAILTRPTGRNMALAQPLTAHGVYCVALPALELTPCTDPAPSPQDFDLIVFVSGFAAQCYFQALPDAAWPDGVLAAGVGPATRQTIQASSRVPPHAILGPGVDTLQDSEALWQTLQAARVQPHRVLIVRGNTGRDWLHMQWRNAGVQVQDFVAYQRRAAVWPTAAEQQLRAAATHAHCTLLVTSAEGARAVDDNLRRLGLTDLWGQCRILTTHPRIASCVEQLQQAAGASPRHPVALTKPDAQTLLQTLLALARSADHKHRDAVP